MQTGRPRCRCRKRKIFVFVAARGPCKKHEENVGPSKTCRCKKSRKNAHGRVAHADEKSKKSASARHRTECRKTKKNVQVGYPPRRVTGRRVSSVAVPASAKTDIILHAIAGAEPALWSPTNPHFPPPPRNPSGKNIEVFARRRRYGRWPRGPELPLPPDKNTKESVRADLGVRWSGSGRRDPHNPYRLVLVLAKREGSARQPAVRVELPALADYDCLMEVAV